MEYSGEAEETLKFLNNKNYLSLGLLEKEKNFANSIIVFLGGDHSSQIPLFTLTKTLRNLNLNIMI